MIREGLLRCNIGLRRSVPLFVAVAVAALSVGWGFQAHKTISGTACEIVPVEIRPFFQANKEWIIAHSGDPDLRAQKRLPDGQRVYPEEPWRHFIDLDELDDPPFQNIPYTSDEAVRRFGRTRLDKAGTVPYVIQDLERRLEESFKHKDWPRAVRLAAWLAHYVADAHMPLHTTKNHDGQETGNDGIHKRFELEMVDRFPEFGRLTASPAFGVRYVRDIPAFVFSFTLSSYRYISKLLKADNVARQTDPSYGERYYSALRDASAGHIAQQRMTDAAHAIASLWYTAWVDAGSPKLPDIAVPQPPDDKLPWE